MPCTDDRCSPSYRNDELTEENKALETMLCSACRQLVKDGYDFDLNPMLSQWWDKHKKADAKREAAEAKEAREIEQCQTLSNFPLSKLTSDDKNLLKKHGYL